MGYVVAWAVYLATVAGLLWVYRETLSGYVPAQWRQVLGVLLAVLLLTPWPADTDSWLPAPAVLGVLFGVMEHSLTQVLKNLLPILLVTGVTGAIAWRRARRMA